MSAVIVPRVTCELPTQTISFRSEWKHLADLTLADLDFGQPGKINLLHQGRWCGLPGSPSAFKTDFEWVLAGETSMHVSNLSIVTHHTAVNTGDGLLRKFWEVEKQPTEYSRFSPEERSVMQHYKNHHSHDNNRHFIIPLPKKHQSKPLGESHSQAVRRYKSLERSLRFRGVYEEFNMVMEEYFEKKHAEWCQKMSLRNQLQRFSIYPCMLCTKISAVQAKYV